jgi:hypothetical protein
VPTPNPLVIQGDQVSGIANLTTTRAQTILPEHAVDLDILVSFDAGSVATGNLNLFIQDSADGGVTWDDLVSTLTFAFAAAAASQRYKVSGRVLPQTVTTAAATNITQGSAPTQESLAAGSARQGPFGAMLRVREKVSGIAGSPTGVTYRIKAAAKF